MKRLLWLAVLLAAFSGISADKKLIIVSPEDGFFDFEKFRSFEQISDVQIKLNPGVYYLDSDIVLNNELLSKVGSLSIEGEKGDTVIFGGKQLPVRNLKTNNGLLSFDAEGEVKGLFVDGKKYRPARFPNYDSKLRPYNGFTSEKDALKTARKKHWEITESVFMHALHRGRWGGYHFKITDRSLFSFKMTGGHQNNRPEHPYSKEFLFIEGIRQELDAEGEYFYNSSERRIYIVPYKGQKITEDSIVEIVTGKNLISFKGDKDLPVKNISLSGITFRGASATFMEPMEPLLRSDWMIYRGGALFIENAENVTVSSCVFEDLDGAAVFVSRHADNIQIKSSIFRRVGSSGIAFVGDPIDVRSPLFNYFERYGSSPDATSGPAGDNHPVNCLVYDNLIFETGLIDKQSAGVQISMASDITVRNNSIYRVPRAGINVSEGTWGGHLIEGNDVFETVLETSDHGAYNSWGRDRFWDKDRNVTDSWVKANPKLPFADVVKPIIIRNNRFQCDYGWDIDLDDGSSNYEIYNNLCLSGGLKLREGFKRIVKNNILLNNTFHPHVWYKEDKTDVFKNNIVFRAYAPVQLKGKGEEIDYNFFHGCKVEGQAFDCWDKNSVSGDALFVDSVNGDFSVLSGSPALSLGFRNFDCSSFGVVSSELKELAKKPEIPGIFSDKDSVTGRSWDWGGLTFKSVETAGEQSAAGLPEIAGVIIVDGSEERLNELGLQKGDVVLQLGKIKTDKVEAFFLAIEHYGRTFSRTAIVYRNQTKITVKLKLKVFGKLKFPGNEW